jgi:hypothetical protein
MSGALDPEPVALGRSETVAGEVVAILLDFF